MLLFQRKTIDPHVVLYSLYLYFLGQSFRGVTLIVAKRSCRKVRGDRYTLIWSHGIIRFVYYRGRNASKIINGL
jgi:hypothetical protein